MITASDSFSIFDLVEYYAILPGDGNSETLYRALGRILTAVPQGFNYNSDSNPDYLNLDQIRALIRVSRDSGFRPVRGSGALRSTDTPDRSNCPLGIGEVGHDWNTKVS